MKLIAFSPHADDIELGCGGTISKLVHEGHEVTVVLVLLKEEKPLHNPNGVTAEQRYGEFKQAMYALGVTQYRVMYDKMPYEFDLCGQPKQQAVTLFDESIRISGADTVLLPVPSFHQDHQWVYEVGISASRPTRYSNKIKEVLLYEYPAANWGPSSGRDPMHGYTDASVKVGHMRKPSE